MKTKIEGIGLGLRFPHFDTILKERPQTPWFEVITDDFLDPGPHHQKLEKLRADYPIVMHSVGMNIAGLDPLGSTYLNPFRELYSRFEPSWISDHLCWSQHEEVCHHDLLPPPRTKESLENICSRIEKLQDFFQRRLLVENITSYVEFDEADFTEPEFLKLILKKTGCGLLLDLTNLVVNSKNNRKDFSLDDLKAFPLDQVGQIHLAGPELVESVWVDTHGAEVGEWEVELLKGLIQLGFDIPAMIERDSHLPSFERLESERKKIQQSVLGEVS